MESMAGLISHGLSIVGGGRIGFVFDTVLGLKSAC